MPRRIEPFRAAPADFDAFMTTSLSIISAQQLKCCVGSIDSIDRACAYIQILV